MAHTTEIAEFKKLNNGQVAALIRCCGSASTDHWHTMAVSVAADPIQRAVSLSIARDFVAAQHEASLQAESGLIDDVMAAPQEHP